MRTHVQHDRSRIIKTSLIVGRLSSNVAWIEIDDRQPEFLKFQSDIVLRFKRKYHSKVCILLVASLPQACKHVVRS